MKNKCRICGQTEDQVIMWDSSTCDNCVEDMYGKDSFNRASVPPEPGDIVMIFTRPLSREKPEGLAEVLEIVRNNAVESAVFAKVRFTSDGHVVFRHIKYN